MPDSTYLIPGGEHPLAPAGYGLGTSSGYSYNTTRTYRTKFRFPIPLGFTVRERAFHVGEIHFRQAWISGKSRGAALNVVRMNGRSEGGDWAPLSPKIFKNTDQTAAEAAILRYYNVVAP